MLSNFYQNSQQPWGVSYREAAGNVGPQVGEKWKDNPTMDV